MLYSLVPVFLRFWNFRSFHLQQLRLLRPRHALTGHECRRPQDNIDEIQESAREVSNEADIDTTERFAVLCIIIPVELLYIMT